MALCLNGSAQQEGPKRKNWNMHDLKTIKPLTPTQEEMFHAWYDENIICAHGSAGTGKTFIAMYLALQEVLEQKQQKIIIVRSAVSTREVGHLPGTLEEKLMQFEQPYHNILWELVGRPSTYNDMKDAGLVEFHSTSFLRGLTWDNAIVVVDEAENLTFHEVDNVMTRLGKNTRIIFTGDTRQTDLDGSKKNGSEGLTEAKKAFAHMKNFATVEFNVHDIVRGEIVKSWIMACETIAA
jgi:phosphate starvation-inducible PhoH-like protein